MKCLTCVLFLALTLWAADSAAYSASKMQLSKREYVRYVRPQVNNLISDFFQFTQYQFVPYIEIKSLHKKYFKIEKKLNALTKIDRKSYSIELTGLNSLLQSTNAKLLSMKQILSKSSCAKKVGSGCLSLHKALNKLISTNLKLISMVDHDLSVNDTIFSNSNTLLFDIKHMIIINRSHWNEFLITLVPDSYKTDYRDVLINFINKLQYMVLIQNDIETFKFRLESLNFLWNCFNSTLTKGNLTLSNAEKKIISTIHFRWNSILKIILKK